MTQRRLAPLLLLPLTACLATTGAPDNTDLTGPENLAQFQPRVQEIARGYGAYQRVDDELHWAPFLCRQPQPSMPRQSQSADLDTHGRKLYYVFAADREGYLGRAGKQPDAVGQVVVKEAWSVVEVPADTPYDKQSSPVRYLKEGDKLYHAEGRAGLFIMYRLAPGTADTDDGWVYATVQEGTGKVTAAGKVSSCMGCHQRSGKGRLFGMNYNGA